MEFLQKNAGLARQAVRISAAETAEPAAAVCAAAGLLLNFIEFLII